MILNQRMKNQKKVKFAKVQLDSNQEKKPDKVKK